MGSIVKTLTGRRESPNRGGGKKDDGSSTVVLKLDLNCEGSAKKVKHSVCHFEVDLDLNLEHLDPPLNSDSRFGSKLNELETTHGRIEERIRELEAIIARARHRQLRNALKISDFSGAHVDRGGKGTYIDLLRVMESIFKQGSGWAYVQVKQRYRQYHHCSGSANNPKAIPVASSHANVQTRTGPTDTATYQQTLYSQPCTPASKRS
ncbi:unnamed protein product [Fraxinus pennsylvanica]|uniref:Uncharacterized protein n=1 Tax=Fraxinus pennsylvanica TaxID=56036 RepID=A0AAD2E6Y6_9LAMI|nr:unnamed protein product [Fraxinus pennsylvanica]